MEGQKAGTSTTSTSKPEAKLAVKSDDFYNNLSREQVETEIDQAYDTMVDAQRHYSKLKNQLEWLDFLDSEKRRKSKKRKRQDYYEDEDYEMEEYEDEGYDCNCQYTNNYHFHARGSRNVFIFNRYY